MRLVPFATDAPYGTRYMLDCMGHLCCVTSFGMCDLCCIMNFETHRNTLCKQCIVLCVHCAIPHATMYWYGTLCYTHCIVWF